VHTYQQQQALQALGDPTRREIFERLTARALAVGELAQDLPISRPAVSQHLKVLK
jgi:DNA-binding transcriptional ArsR family regulator